MLKIKMFFILKLQSFISDRTTPTDRDIWTFKLTNRHKKAYNYKYTDTLTYSHRLDSYRQAQLDIKKPTTYPHTPVDTLTDTVISELDRYSF